MNQRDVGTYGSQPVENQLTIEAVGIRVESKFIGATSLNGGNGKLLKVYIIQTLNLPSLLQNSQLPQRERQLYWL